MTRHAWTSSATRWPRSWSGSRAPTRIWSRRPSDALITAQQLRAETREQAEREAQLILREARAEGEKLVEEARRTVRRLESQVDALERARKAYLAQWRAFTERQRIELEAAEAAPAPERPVVEEPNGAAREKAPSWLDEAAPDDEAK
jgi:cell division septum initiation protein DivIVA